MGLGRRGAAKGGDGHAAGTRSLHGDCERIFSLPITGGLTMKPTMVMSAVFGMVLAGAPVVWGQVIDPTPYARYQYAAKFVCGTAGENPLQVVKGTYATAMNVHNPSLNQNATFIKKVAVAFPD